MTWRSRVLLSTFLLVFALGCRLFKKNAQTEVVYASTEVGAPQGDKVVKQIGAAGGALSSPDGRLTLTVPPNAVAASVEFSIQPIKNTAELGLGLAYRLEPSGRSFNPPLRLGFRYGEEDVRSTQPEELRLAYQDPQRQWHERTSPELDTSNKLITISTPHLSDWAVKPFRSVGLKPGYKAVVRIGESLGISVEKCEGIITAPATYLKVKCSLADECKWTLQGQGTLTKGGPQMLYTAPLKKPEPPVATVTCAASSFFPGWRKSAHKIDIAIIDRGWRATGQSGPIKFSGVICDLKKPFTLTGKSMLEFVFKFTPSSETAGTVDITETGWGTAGKGSGTYFVTGLVVGKPSISIDAKYTSRYGMASASGGGLKTVELVPLDSDDCNKSDQPTPVPPPVVGDPRLGGKGPL